MQVKMHFNLHLKWIFKLHFKMHFNCILKLFFKMQCYLIEVKLIMRLMNHITSKIQNPKII